MTDENNQTGPQPARYSEEQIDEQDESRDAAKQTPAYNDPVPGRGESRDGGETNDRSPPWRPVDSPVGQPDGSSGQTETEPGRSRLDGDGVEEIPEAERTGAANM